MYKLYSQFPVILTPIVVSLILFTKMLLPETQFFMDWVNSYWMMLKAGESSFPAWFLGPSFGQWPQEPWFLYYGGYPYLFLISISNFFQIPALVVYRSTYLVLAMLMSVSVAGISWRFTKRPWISGIIGAFSVISPYFLANAYGRGAFSEYIFVSLVPVLIVSCLGSLFSRSKLLRSIFLILTSLTTTLILTTHTVSLILLGSSFLLYLIIFSIIAISSRDIRGKISKLLLKQSKEFIGLTLALLSGLFISLPQFLPALTNSASTVMANSPTTFSAVQLTSVSEILKFWPVPYENSGTPDLATQTLTLLLIWCAGFSIIYFRKFTQIQKRMFIGLWTFVILLFMLMSWNPIWKFLPTVILAVQFPYRYLSYLVFGILAITIAVVSATNNIKSFRFLALPSLVVIFCISLAGAFSQVQNVISYPQQEDLRNLSTNFKPKTWYAPYNSFAQIGTTIGISPTGVLVSKETPDSSEIQIICSGYNKTIIPTYAPPPLVKIDGARVLGTTNKGAVVIDTTECKSEEILNLTITKISSYQKNKVQILISIALGILALIWAIAYVNFHKKKKKIKILHSVNRASF